MRGDDLRKAAHPDIKTETINLSEASDLGWKSPSARMAVFIIIAGNDLGRIYSLNDASITIGRGIDNSIQIQDDAVSRYHARVVRSGENSFVAEDLGSTNGTFLNGERIDHHELTDGDKLMVGTTTILKFSFHDALEMQFQKHLFDSAVRDWLTKCFNKKYLDEHLPVEFNFAKRHNSPLSVILLDIDHFKNVNDEHGHMIGDHVLWRLSQELAGILRNEDLFVRFGGEEFLVLARETPPEAAAVLAERLRQHTNSLELEYAGYLLHTTISLGVATFTGDENDSPESLIERADQALYRAKEGGRNRVETDSAS